MGVHSPHSYSILNGNPSQSNKTGERIKRDLNREGRNQIIPIFR
jgi:hypothetical protein